MAIAGALFATHCSESTGACSGLHPESRKTVCFEDMLEATCTAKELTLGSWHKGKTCAEVDQLGNELMESHGW